MKGMFFEVKESIGTGYGSKKKTQKVIVEAISDVFIRGGNGGSAYFIGARVDNTIDQYPISNVTKRKGGFSDDSDRKADVKKA